VPPIQLDVSESIASRTRARSKSLTKMPSKLSVMSTKQKRHRLSKGNSTVLIFTQGLHHPLGELTVDPSAVSEDLVRRSTRTTAKREGYKSGSVVSKQAAKKR
jgi:hypothetical protein